MSLGWQIVEDVDDQNAVVGDIRIRGARLARLEDHVATVAQAVRVTLRWWRGEWFLDTRRGTPYLESVLKKGVTEATVRAVLKRVIEGVQGVARVESMRVTLDRATRAATVDEIVIVATDGSELTLSSVAVGAA